VSRVYWKTFRQFDLALAGVDVTMVVVDLAAFLRWRARTGRPADERALDAFASLARGPPAAGVRIVAAHL
jgi:hypothetical protein